MDAASPEAKFNLVRSDQANSFYVLGTDYTNYAVMWWCGPKRNTTEHIGEWAWREEIYGDRTEHIGEWAWREENIWRHDRAYSPDNISEASLRKALQETVSDDCQHRCSNCSWWLVAEEGTHFNTGKVGDVTLFRVRALQGISLVRYVRYLGVGDSKGCLKVCEAQSDGEEVMVEKLESVGHVKKILGVTWVSSRSRTLDAKYQAKADQILPPGDYLASDQSGCP
uniref:Uncharacterized protein n=1 Tax=Timema douglasi TaxID=61478 RepID=A0A7R8VX77_TIMDO|nr:unnamed protein product [Timema douglasi]